MRALDGGLRNPPTPVDALPAADYSKHLTVFMADILCTIYRAGWQGEKTKPMPNGKMNQAW